MGIVRTQSASYNCEAGGCCTKLAKHKGGLEEREYRSLALSAWAAVPRAGDGQVIIS